MRETHKIMDVPLIPAWC